jgi:hypothetical protein
VDSRGGLAELPAVNLPAPPSPQALALAQRDTVLRFAVGVTAAFVMSEALNWRPTAMAPVLSGVLLSSLPVRPPLKLCLVILASMLVASSFTWFVSVLLRDTPFALWLAVSTLFFASFLAMLRGAPALPCTLMLVSLAVIPVVAVASPQYVDLLPGMLSKAILIALLVTLSMHALFPRTLPPVRPPAPAKPDDAVVLAIAATLVVMPVMLVFLLYSPTQAMPVMVTTVFLAAHFDPSISRRDAWVRVVANAAGGALGATAHLVLVAAPSLYTLGLLTFLLAFGFAILMVRRAWPMSTLVLANTGCFVIFSSAIAAGPSSAGVALQRVVYFSMAGLFATVVMFLVWSWLVQRAPRPQPV